jgi:hypothetical protein
MLAILNTLEIKITRSKERSGTLQRSGIKEQLQILHAGAGRRK